MDLNFYWGFQFRKHTLQEYKEVLKFDPRANCSEWQTLYGFADIGNRDRHYITYGGGPEGGIMISYGDGWFAWHRNWNERIQYTRIPDELEIIYRNDDGHEAIKMFMSNDSCEVGDDKYYLDDLGDGLDWRHRVSETDGESDEEESDEDMDRD